MIRQWILRIIERYRRWDYLRQPRAPFIPTVNPSLPQLAWSQTQEQMERELYLESPLAVWLRPDRHEHDTPFWMIEGVWEPPIMKASNGNQNIYIGYQVLRHNVAIGYFREPPTDIMRR